MAKKLVVQSTSGDIWVIDIDASNVRELTGDERTRMARSLGVAEKMVNVSNAVYGDDIVGPDASGHDKLEF